MKTLQESGDRKANFRVTIKQITVRIFDVFESEFCQLETRAVVFVMIPGRDEFFHHTINLSPLVMIQGVDSDLSYFRLIIKLLRNSTSEQGFFESLISLRSRLQMKLKTAFLKKTEVSVNRSQSFDERFRLKFERFFK